jgi:hypothetical protein
MKKFIFFISVIFIMFTIAGCYTENTSTKEAHKVSLQQEQYAVGQPIPSFDWSFERDLVIQLYKLRNEKVATHTIWRSDYGMIEYDCPSLGYGIPYDTSLTNPLMTTDEDPEGFDHSALVAVEQPEPNGIFSSKNTTATWVMSVDEETGQILPIYVESKVTVFPYPIRVDYEKNRVYRTGKPSTSINVN